MTISALWAFMSDTDKKKIRKTGTATPRGGAKNAYQNHVSRSGRVIVPFERLDDVDVSLYEDGYVVRVLPEQCFASSGELAPALCERGIEVGPDAFVLYRTKSAYEDLPPFDAWSPRGISSGRLARERGVPDTGEYVVRLSNPTVKEGMSQGIFAPEYASAADNALCQAVLTWLIGRTRDHPYEDDEFDALTTRLRDEDPALIAPERLASAGIVVDDEARCPLCLRPLLWRELHEMLDLTEVSGLANAQIQIAGGTRSTAVNLFHMQPLLYGRPLHHKPHLVAWGHATCNTLLGQRVCVPFADVQAKGFVLTRGGDTPWGYASADESMLRSADQGVWARLVERGLTEIPITETLGPEIVSGDRDWDWDV